MNTFSPKASLFHSIRPQMRYHLPRPENIGHPSRLPGKDCHRSVYSLYFISQISFPLKKTFSGIKFPVQALSSSDFRSSPVFSELLSWFRSCRYNSVGRCCSPKRSCLTCFFIQYRCPASLQKDLLTASDAGKNKKNRRNFSRAIVS